MNSAQRKKDKKIKQLVKVGLEAQQRIAAAEQEALIRTQLLERMNDTRQSLESRLAHAQQLVKSLENEAAERVHQHAAELRERGNELKALQVKLDEALSTNADTVGSLKQRIEQLTTTSESLKKALDEEIGKNIELRTRYVELEKLDMDTKKLRRRKHELSQEVDRLTQENKALKARVYAFENPTNVGDIRITAPPSAFKQKPEAPAVIGHNVDVGNSDA